MALSNAERQRRYRERLKGKLAHVAQAAATDPHSALRDALWKLYVTDDVATAESLAEAAMRDLEARLAGWLVSNTALDGETPSDDQGAAFFDAWKAAIRISVPSIKEVRRREAEAKRAARVASRGRETRQSVREVSMTEPLIQNGKRRGVT